MNARSLSTWPIESELLLGHLRTHKPFRTVRKKGVKNWLLIYNCSGHAFFRYAGGELRTKPGDVVLLPSGFPHDYGCDQASSTYVRLYSEFQPRAEWRELLQWPEAGPGVRKLTLKNKQTRQRVEQSFTEAIALAMSHHRRRDRFALNALEKVLLWCDTEKPHDSTPPPDARIGRALDYLTQHFARPITLTALAAHCGLSVSRLSWLFHQATGTSPLRYLELRRLDRARQLLRMTQNPIQEIAAEVGYHDPFYFSLRFKRHTGMCPRQFRAT